MDIKNTLFKLSDAVAVGNISDASDIAYEILSRFALTERMNNLTVIGKLEGKSDYTIMFDAHIDEIAMIVTDIDENGFLTVAKSGGIDLRTLPARAVTVHGKKDVPAVFCSTPPHLSSGEIEYDDITKIKLDTGLGKAAKEIITVGDYVTSRTKAKELLNTRVTGKAIDDRAGVVCLLELAERLSKKELPCNVVFSICDGEELGMRGTRTAAFKVNPNEAIAIDVSFADSPDVPSDECGKLSDGAMIGISPVLDNSMSNKLIAIANDENIVTQNEIMGGRTGTNADMIALTRCGVRTGLISVPLRNMHTDVELVDLNDIKGICDILEKYVLSGGVADA